MMLRRANKEKSILKKIYYYQEGIKILSQEKHYCKKFNLNITCSSIDSKRLSKISPNISVEDIPNGVDINYFRPVGFSQKKHSMIFAGGMSWYPNVAAMKFFVFEVLPRIIKNAPDAHLTIVGRNPPAWLIEHSKQNNNLSVTGFVDDVRPYIEQASVYVCPINDGGGTKLKILDALAMGKAIVAHPIACEGIDVTDQVNICFASSPQEYEEKILELFGNDNLRNEMGNKARLFIERKYDFVQIGKKMNTLYIELFKT